MWKKAEALAMTAEQRKVIEAWVRAEKTPQRIVLRSRICLLAADGASHNAIAKSLATSRSTVILWTRRFQEQGLTGISEDAPHGASTRCLNAEKVKAIVEATLYTKPQNAAQWSTRTMAQVQGVSHSTIQRIWEAHGLQPHRARTSRMFNHKRSKKEPADVVGVYLNPPDKVVVMCVDKKTQVQTLGGLQQGLPEEKGCCVSMTGGDKPKGTSCLITAMNNLEIKVLEACYSRHRHAEFLKFLRAINRSVTENMNIHLILDNYGTYEHPKVKAWLDIHPHFNLHFTPAGSSWLNLIERWFGGTTGKKIQNGVFRSIPELISAIEDYVGCKNENSQPFIWTKRTGEILKKASFS